MQNAPNLNYCGNTDPPPLDGGAEDELLLVGAAKHPFISVLHVPPTAVHCSCSLIPTDDELACDDAELTGESSLELEAVQSNPGKQSSEVSITLDELSSLLSAELLFCDEGLYAPLYIPIYVLIYPLSSS